MAIIAACASPNFAHGNYHRLLRVEMVCAPGEENPRYIAHVGHYHSAEARQLNSTPMHVNIVAIPFSELAIDPRIALYEKMMEDPMFVALNAVSDEVEQE